MFCGRGRLRLRLRGCVKGVWSGKRAGWYGAEMDPRWCCWRLLLARTVVKLLVGHLVRLLLPRLLSCPLDVDR